MMDAVTNDLRYAARLLWRSPGFTVVAVLALALGIGATTTLFSVVNAVLMRPLPYPDPDDLVVIRETKLPQFTSFSVAPGNYLDWTDRQTTLESMAAYATVGFNLTGVETPEALQAARITASLFQVLGVEPAMGRAFTSQDDRVGATPVVIVSDGFAERHFGDASRALGSTVSLDGRSHLIVGVMPADFEYPYPETEVWTPMAFTPDEQNNHGSHFMRTVARLAPGVSIQAALSELQTIALRLQEEHPDSNNGWNVRMESLMERTVGDARPSLLLLLAAVVLMLLIACANVANMLLARAADRHKEMVVRLALGARRAQIVRQLLIESLLLAIIGTGVGLVLAYWGVELLPSLAPRLPRLDTVGLDGSTLAFAAGLALVVTLLFGLVPAIQGTAGMATALNAEGRGSSGSVGRRRVRHGLVVVEIALALVLLVGAGLLIRSFSNLQAVDPGFDASGVLLARIELPESQYEEPASFWPFYQRLIERLSRLPGVSAAGATRSMPFVSDYVLGLHIDGRPLPEPSEFPATNYYAVSPGYFEAMGIRLVRGRLFTERDREGAVRVAIINETFAARHFPGEDPIGQRVWVTQGQQAYREIVGIVRDVEQYALDVEPPAQTYEPAAQQPFRQMTLVVRSTIDPASLANAVRAEVEMLDPNLPVSRVETLEATLGRWLVRRRAPMQILASFAGIALLLAGLGIYGVLAYSVAQRTREVGIRMALGARGRDVRRLVVREGMLLAAMGLGTGILASLLVTRAMASLLFGVGAQDPPTFMLIPLLLAAVAFLASYLPARRATRVDPVVALRVE